jgi:hypothetical protein
MRRLAAAVVAAALAAAALVGSAAAALPPLARGVAPQEVRTPHTPPAGARVRASAAADAPRRCVWLHTQNVAYVPHFAGLPCADTGSCPFGPNCTVCGNYCGAGWCGNRCARQRVRETACSLSDNHNGDDGKC